MKFFKMSGTGNDFVLLDNRDGSLGAGLDGLVPRLCHRRNGVGADGVLLIERSDQADFRMRYLNADGGEVSFCGNGGRCIAYFAHAIGAAGPAMSFTAGDGPHTAEVVGRRVRLSMRDPQDIRLNFILDLDTRGYAASFADTGVPHVVVPVVDLAGFDVAAIGKRIRDHRMFEPAGTNANFIEIEGRHRLRIRTYERGVEDETLACGTGATAAAVVSALRGLMDSPVECLTRGGETLAVHFDRRDDVVTDVSLEGDVRLLFTGEWDEHR
jgi:diaminopimelate epimerase